MRTYNLLLLQRLDGETAINMLEEQKKRRSVNSYKNLFCTDSND